MRAQSLFSRLASTNSRANRSRQQRQLRMESLEPRWVFSAAPVGEVVDACVPEVATEIAEGERLVAPLSIGPAYPVVPSMNIQLPPAPQQPTTSAVLGQALLEVMDGAEGEDVFHINMTGQNVGNGNWNFWGTVGTLAGHSGAHVEFGGLLAGQTATLDQNGQFSYTHHFNFGTVGTVTGKGVDSAGNVTDNVSSVYVFV